MIIMNKGGEHMAIQVNSIAQLKAVMMQQVKEAMEHTEHWLVNETKDVINKEVYNKYTPTVYDRTDALINSVDVVERQGSNRYYSLTVGHFPSYWHSIGQGYIDYVPHIVHYGKTGTYVGYGESQHGEYKYHKIIPKGTPYGRPRPYMDKTVKRLKTGNRYLRHLVANIGNGATIV